MISRPFLFASITCLFSAATVCVGQENIGGVGVALRVKDGQVFVAKLIQGGPADRSGEIRENDQLLTVAEGDGAAVKAGPTMTDAQQLIKGPVGSTVRLTVLPAGKPESEARVVSLVRAQLKGIWGDGKLLPEGADAPELDLVRLPDDQPDRLSNHRGKAVVLVFWASWCGPCQEHMAMLQTLPEKHPEWKDKVVLLAVSVEDDKAKAAKHVNEKEWNQTLNVWAGEKALRIYHVDGIPASYVITLDGKVAAADPRDIEATVARLVR